MSSTLLVEILRGCCAGAIAPFLRSAVSGERNQIQVAAGFKHTYGMPIRVVTLADALPDAHNRNK